MHLRLCDTRLFEMKRQRRPKLPGYGWPIINSVCFALANGTLEHGKLLAILGLLYGPVCCCSLPPQFLGYAP
jgi:hypothetical protein